MAPRLGKPSCAVPTAGPWAGKTVAIKDSIAVGGVPMTNGSRVSGRLRARGGCHGGDRHLGGRRDPGKIHQRGALLFRRQSHRRQRPGAKPHHPTRSSGGPPAAARYWWWWKRWTWRSAVIKADRCGRQRALCGVYGLKPTYGLVPYTGAFPLEMTLDHLGPLAASVRDVAALLEGTAGPDGLDPRQGGVEPAPYLPALTGSVRGMPIGRLVEGFRWPGVSEPDVDAAVEEACRAFSRRGAKVVEVSAPWHRDGPDIWAAIATEGAVPCMPWGNGLGSHWNGYYPRSLEAFFARAWRHGTNQLPPTVKRLLVVGGYLWREAHGQYCARAQNLARVLRQAYDGALAQCDLLVLPTLSMKATLLSSPEASVLEYLARASGTNQNLSPFTVTGRPAMNVPCAISSGLPVGMMLVGRWGDEATVLRAADAFERQVFKPPAPPRR